MAVRCDNAANIVVTELHVSGTLRPAVFSDKLCQDNGEVTESLLPSCCLAGGARQEANVGLFLGKSLITAHDL